MKLSSCLFAISLAPTLLFSKEKETKAALPDATLANVKWGTMVNTAAFNKDELTGKVVVVEEWGVNCGPCIASLPNLAKLAKSNDKKGLVVVGLECQGGSKETITKLLKTARVEYPIMSGGSAPGGTGTIPHVCVFDATGKLIYNGNPHAGDFESTVKKALRDIKPAPASALGR